MKMEDVGKGHVDAYNSLFDNKIFDNVIANVPPLKIRNFKAVIDDIEITAPYVNDNNSVAVDRRLYPNECRRRGLSYSGKMNIKIGIYKNGALVDIIYKKVGQFPVMVGSKYCHTTDAENLAQIGEDEGNLGGYFIMNGLEKVVRFNIAQKRNYALAFTRASKDKNLSKYLVQIRSVGPDEIGKINSIHYCLDGNILFSLFMNRIRYFLPMALLLKAIVNTTDEEIYNALGKSPKALKMLSSSAEFNSFSRNECLRYIGSKFKTVMNTDDDLEAGEIVIKTQVLPHLNINSEKFDFLIVSTHKLFELTSNNIVEDNVDLPSNHEIYTVAHYFASIIRDKLDDYFRSANLLFKKSFNKTNSKRALDESNSDPHDDFSEQYLIEIFKKSLSDIKLEVYQALYKFIATGNINSTVSSDFLQNSGLSVTADRINFYRFMSHFRAINRGSYFAELKVTTVRKLRPESWVFICPVHTPDGTPCGILTHMSKGAEIISYPDKFSQDVLFEFGVIPVMRGVHIKIPVFLDGKVVGSTNNVAELATKLREYRNKHNLKIEIVGIENPKLFPSVLIYNTVGRFTRKVKNIKFNNEEWIGIMEQVFLNINLESHEKYTLACKMDTPYEEIDNNLMFSLIAGLIPYPDYNQSPRNMYQCQMAKQAMGLPSHNIFQRNDNKLYSLNYLQAPIVHTQGYDLVKDYPLGINCIVAVLAYTAYDMEDAVVINKSSIDRGLFTGYIYKTIRIELEKNSNYFTYLPSIGEPLKFNDIICRYVSENNTEKIVKYHETEVGCIHKVEVYQNDTKCASITIRIIRNPTIGDKFCSRHGQKGVCSMQWPYVDMPFTENGICPDIIINPHAFPSRMTIGMLMESMAGKSGCIYGKMQDATPFKKKTFLNKELIGNTQHDEELLAEKRSIGDELKEAGFNYYGNEPMYSGVSGNEFKVDIFIGVVFYQRLRHMVNDKFQVRTSGPVVQTTKQPVGGRKKHGGIRFGEMERDALLAHGISYCLRDRLMKCSDRTIFNYCVKCKSILFTNKKYCDCGNKEFKAMEMPYVFKYLCCELMGMNIKVKIEV